MADELVVFCPFTRAWAVAPFFEALAASDVPFERARFIAYVDTNDRGVEEAIRAECGRLPFAAVRVVTSGRAAPQDRSPRARRARHALMRQSSQDLLGDGPLLLLEDDTLIPVATYAHLSATLNHCDWAIGAEVGRWGNARPPGVWRIEADKGQLQAKVAMLPSGRDYERVDACGFYCALTTGEVYKQADFTSWAEGMGLDVHSTWRLSQAGRVLMVDWRVPCVHLTDDGERLTMADAKPFSASLAGCGRMSLRKVEVPKPQLRPLKYPIAIGINCELDGRIYPKGSRIDRETAIALKAAGQLKDPRIV